MLKLIHAGGVYPIPARENLCVTHTQDGLDKLAFDLAAGAEIYPLLAEEDQIEYNGGRYVVKSIDASGDRAAVLCELDLDMLRARFYRTYQSGDVTLWELLGTVLPAGWTAAGYNPGARHIVSLESATDYDIVVQAAETYQVFFRWHIAAKQVEVIDPNDNTPSGEYLSDELNLRSVAFKGESTGLITRLYPYGADGLTIAGINNGVEYVENHRYSDKIISAGWTEEAYTDSASLKAAAEEKLASLSIPARSYECDTVDLAKLSPDYAAFALDVHKVVTLIDRQRSLRIDHRVVEYQEYPDEPERNVVTLSSVVKPIQETIDGVQDNLEETTAKVQASIKQTESEIELCARKDNLISLINVSPEGIRIDANRLDITGVITAEDLEGEGTTVINGANITTGRIESESGDWWLDLESGEAYLSKGTFAGEISWGDNNYIKQFQSGETMLSADDSIHVMAPFLSVVGNIGCRALTCNLNAECDNLICNTIKCDNIEVDGTTGYSSEVGVVMSNGKNANLIFKKGIYTGYVLDR